MAKFINPRTLGANLSILQNISDRNMERKERERTKERNDRINNAGADFMSFLNQPGTRTKEQVGDFFQQSQLNPQESMHVMKFGMEMYNAQNAFAPKAPKSRQETVYNQETGRPEIISRPEEGAFQYREGYSPDKPTPERQLSLLERVTQRNIGQGLDPIKAELEGKREISTYGQTPTPKSRRDLVKEDILKTNPNLKGLKLERAIDSDMNTFKQSISPTAKKDTKIDRENQSMHLMQSFKGIPGFQEDVDGKLGGNIAKSEMWKVNKLGINTGHKVYPFEQEDGTVSFTLVPIKGDAGKEVDETWEISDGVDESGNQMFIANSVFGQQKRMTPENILKGVGSIERLKEEYPIVAAALERKKEAKDKEISLLDLENKIESQGEVNGMPIAQTKFGYKIQKDGEWVTPNKEERRLIIEAFRRGGVQQKGSVPDYGRNLKEPRSIEEQRDAFLRSTEPDIELYR